MAPCTPECISVNNELRIKIASLQRRLQHEREKNVSDFSKFRTENTTLRKLYKDLQEQLRSEKEKNTAIITDLITRENEAREKVKSKAKIMHMFTTNTSAVFRGAEMEKIASLCKTFCEIEGPLSVCYSDVMSMRSTVQDVMQKCRDCRESAKQERIQYEKKISEMNNLIVNLEFMNKQLQHGSPVPKFLKHNHIELKAHNASKKEKKDNSMSSFPPTPESTSSVDSNACEDSIILNNTGSFETPKLPSPKQRGKSSKRFLVKAQEIPSSNSSFTSDTDYSTETGSKTETKKLKRPIEHNHTVHSEDNESNSLSSGEYSKQEIQNKQNCKSKEDVDLDQTVFKNNQSNIGLPHTSPLEKPANNTDETKHNLIEDPKNVDKETLLLVLDKSEVLAFDTAKETKGYFKHENKNIELKLPLLDNLTLDKKIEIMADTKKETKDCFKRKNKNIELKLPLLDDLKLDKKSEIIVADNAKETTDYLKNVNKNLKLPLLLDDLLFDEKSKPTCLLKTEDCPTPGYSPRSEDFDDVFKHIHIRPILENFEYIDTSTESPVMKSINQDIKKEDNKSIINTGNESDLQLQKIESSSNLGTSRKRKGLIKPQELDEIKKEELVESNFKHKSSSPPNKKQESRTRSIFSPKRLVEELEEHTDSYNGSKRQRLDTNGKMVTTQLKYPHSDHNYFSYCEKESLKMDIDGDTIKEDACKNESEKYEYDILKTSLELNDLTIKCDSSHLDMLVDFENIPTDKNQVGSIDFRNDTINILDTNNTLPGAITISPKSKTPRKLKTKARNKKCKTVSECRIKNSKIKSHPMQLRHSPNKTESPEYLKKRLEVVNVSDNEIYQIITSPSSYKSNDRSPTSSISPKAMKNKPDDLKKRLEVVNVSDNEIYQIITLPSSYKSKDRSPTSSISPKVMKNKYSSNSIKSPKNNKSPQNLESPNSKNSVTTGDEIGPKISPRSSGTHNYNLRPLNSPSNELHRCSYSPKSPEKQMIKSDSPLSEKKLKKELEISKKQESIKSHSKSTLTNVDTQLIQRMFLSTREERGLPSVEKQNELEVPVSINDPLTIIIPGNDSVSEEVYKNNKASDHNAFGGKLLIPYDETNKKLLEYYKKVKILSPLEDEELSCRQFTSGTNRSRINSNPNLLENKESSTVKSPLKTLKIDLNPTSVDLSKTTISEVSLFENKEFVPIKYSSFENFKKVNGRKKHFPTMKKAKNKSMKSLDTHQTKLSNLINDTSLVSTTPSEIGPESVITTQDLISSITSESCIKEEICINSNQDGKDTERNLEISLNENQTVNDLNIKASVQNINSSLSHSSPPIRNKTKSVKTAQARSLDESLSSGFDTLRLMNNCKVEQSNENKTNLVEPAATKLVVNNVSLLEESTDLNTENMSLVNASSHQLIKCSSHEKLKCEETNLKTHSSPDQNCTKSKNILQDHSNIVPKIVSNTLESSEIIDVNLRENYTLPIGSDNTLVTDKIVDDNKCKNNLFGERMTNIETSYASDDDCLVIDDFDELELIDDDPEESTPCQSTHANSLPNCESKFSSSKCNKNSNLNKENPGVNVTTLYKDVGVEPSIPVATNKCEESSFNNVDCSSTEKLPCSYSPIRELHSSVSTNSVSNETKPEENPDGVKIYAPNFYTEHTASDDSNNTFTITDDETEEKSNMELTETKFRFPPNIEFEQKTLDELIPTGEKIEVNQNIFRIVFARHSKNLQDYKNRNVKENRSEKRPIVPDNIAEEVAALLDSPITKGLQSLVDARNIATKLKEYSCSAILKGLTILLRRVAEKALSKKKSREKNENSWIKNLEYNNMKPRQRSPCVNDRVKAVMVLLTLVADQKYDDIDHKSQFMDAALQFCEKLFFTEESVTEVLMFMGYLYTCLAEQSRALTRVRTLIYDLLYSFTKKFHCIIFAILSTWPEVLRVKPIESYMDDPVSLAVINAFFHVTAEGNFGKNKINSFLRFLKQKYQFDATTTNIDELFDMFITQLRWEEVHKAIILLAKKGNRGWFQKRPLGVLLDVVRQWKADKRSNEEAVCALKVIGYCVRSFNGATQQHIMQPVFELLRDILLDKNTPAWMQEVVVMTLCYIARVDWSACANLIASWKPREVSSEIFDKILVELISRRPPVWWTRTRDSRPFLNI